MSRRLTIGAFSLLAVFVILKFWLWSPPKCPSKFFERHGDLPGCETISAGNDISADGLRVAGYSSADETSTPNDCTDALHKNEATGWTRHCASGPSFWPGKPQGLIGLGYLPSPAEGSLAYGISPDGLVSVGISDETLNHNVAVVFLPAGVKKLVLPTGQVIATAADVSSASINDPPTGADWGVEDPPLMRGRIVVGWTSEGGNYPFYVAGGHAVFWKSWTSVVFLTLPALPNAQRIISSEANSVSDTAMRIGGALYYNIRGEAANYRSYPCVWRFSGGGYVPEVLNDLDGGDTNARITHISGDGKVAVGWGTVGEGDSLCYAYPKIACKWVNDGTAWGNPIPLKPLPDFPYSSASGTNEDGSVVAGTSFSYECASGDFQARATLWHGNANLDIAGKLGKKATAGIILWEAKRVSRDGAIVTGYSWDDSMTTQDGWTAGLK